MGIQLHFGYISKQVEESIRQIRRGLGLFALLLLLIQPALRSTGAATMLLSSSVTELYKFFSLTAKKLLLLIQPALRSTGAATMLLSSSVTEQSKLYHEHGLKLTCIRCGFEYMQKQHRCVKADIQRYSATGCAERVK